jgi:hypothetical protein
MKPGKSKGSYSVDSQTYINECNWERKAKRSIEVQSNAKPLTWGKCCEKIAFDKIGLDYTLMSDQTIQHPTINFWVGSPDAHTLIKCGDLKCPQQLESFRKMSDPFYDKDTGSLLYEAFTIEALRKNHKDGDKFYWQVVSNSILLREVKGLNITKGQIIIFVPYEDELQEIKDSCDGSPDYYSIWASSADELPYLNRDGDFKNINIIEFDIMPRDVDALTERVKEAGELLTPWK